MAKTIFWFRRDLRLQDNAGLYYALKEQKEVMPLFVFDKDILHQLDDKQDKRVNFIYQTILQLKKDLQALGSDLWVYYDTPLAVWEQLTAQYEIEHVYTNHDYEPYAQKRDKMVEDFLKTKYVYFHTFKDQTIFEKDEILTDAQKPYTVFTPYSRKWKKQLNDFYLKSYPCERYYPHLAKKTDFLPYTLPTLEMMGFEPIAYQYPAAEVPVNIVSSYDKQRDFPAIQGTTRLSVHLRFGTVSVRKLAQIARQTNETWLNELIWRDFYMMILYHFPHVAERAFKPAYDQIQWRNDEKEFQAWCEGNTGYPIVDAGMRELNVTGFMHNRVRMIVASFLTKHLLIDWRWGEQYFAKKLLDFDLSANNGGWQWAAGSGCDAAPYFRVFNPALQTDKFDKEKQYIKQWLPTFNTAAYPKPIVVHEVARNRALATYKAALDKSETASS